MTTEDTPEIPSKKPIGFAKNKGVAYTPEVKGSKRSGKLDWTLDELIAYKSNGYPPARIPDAVILYKLGKAGVSLKNAADIFSISEDKFYSNPDWLENWQKGRAELSSRVRAAIVDQALEQNVLNAMIYLDKIIGGDSPADQLNVTVTNVSNLENVSTEDLLDVMYRDGKDPS